MTGMEKKLAFLLATSPHLDTLSGSYDEAARDLVANGVVPVVRCKDCKYYRTHGQIHGMCYYGTGIRFMFNDGFCSYGERRADDATD